MTAFDSCIAAFLVKVVHLISYHISSSLPSHSTPYPLLTVNHKWTSSHSLDCHSCFIYSAQYSAQIVARLPEPVKNSYIRVVV